MKLIDKKQQINILEDYKKLIIIAKENKMNNLVILSLVAHKNLQEEFIKKID